MAFQIWSSKYCHVSFQMAFRIRSSKYRHVFGSAAKKEHCYECVKITKNAHDSNFCAVNPKFLAVVVECAGGGQFLVIPLEKVSYVYIYIYTYIYIYIYIYIHIHILIYI